MANNLRYGAETTARHLYDASAQASMRKVPVKMLPTDVTATADLLEELGAEVGRLVQILADKGMCAACGEAPNCKDCGLVGDLAYWDYYCYNCDPTGICPVCDPKDEGDV